MSTIINLMYTTPIALSARADEDEYQIDIELGPVSLDMAINKAKELLNRPHITSVLGWDITTGEILFTVEEEIEDMEEIPEEPDWIDDDYGFDPYLGCYSDDC